METQFGTKVAIRQELSKCLPFGSLQAREPVATIFSFVDYRYKVIPLFQTISHKTRAYIFNAGGLKGFLLLPDPQKLLQRADSNSLLEPVKKH